MFDGQLDSYLSKDELFSFAMGNMYLGSDIMYQSFIEDLPQLPFAEKEARDEYIDSVKSLVAQVTSEDSTKGTKSLFCWNGTREIFGDKNVNEINSFSENGEMIFTPNKEIEGLKCPSNIEGTGSYRSSEHQLKVPLYYFQGSHDPATPATGALSHYVAQSQSPQKEWIEVRGGGHVVLTVQLEQCVEKIWETIFNLGSVKSLLDVNGHCFPEN